MGQLGQILKKICPKFVPTLKLAIFGFFFSHLDYNDSENVFFIHNASLFQCAWSKGLKEN